MRTVLLVDDNQSVRDTLQVLLSHFGYAVLAAEDGATGIALFTEHPIDAALVDVHMPGMDGFGVCRVLKARARETGKELPVWLMSGIGTPANAQLATEVGAVALLNKPFDFPAFRKQLEAELRPAGGAP